MLMIHDAKSNNGDDHRFLFFVFPLAHEVLKVFKLFLFPEFDA